MTRRTQAKTEPALAQKIMLMSGPALGILLAAVALALAVYGVIRVVGETLVKHVE